MPKPGQQNGGGQKENGILIRENTWLWGMGGGDVYAEIL